MKTITITGIQGRSLPLVHSGGAPMPTTKPGQSYVVPRATYYVRAWHRGDVACAELDAEHGISAPKTKTTKQADKAGK